MKIKCHWCKKDLIIGPSQYENKYKYYRCIDQHISYLVDVNVNKVAFYEAFLDIDNIRYKIRSRGMGIFYTTINSRIIGSTKDYTELLNVDFMVPFSLSEDGVININHKFVERIKKMIVFS